MEQNLTELFLAKTEMVKKGLIVEATEEYFAENATTLDFDGTATKGKPAMLEKMRQFAGAISNVNGITLHHTAIHNQVTFAEFTFDFDMKDVSKILWHEIIRSIWENNQIVNEEYFKN